MSDALRRPLSIEAGDARAIGRSTPLPVTPAIAGWIALLAFGLDALGAHTLQWVDAWVAVAVDVNRSTGVGTAMGRVTNAAPWIGAAFVVAAVLLARRRGAELIELGWAGVVLGVGLLLAQALKMIFERDRPGVVPWEHATHSFPSGHLANAVLCAGMAVILLWRHRPPRAALTLAVAFAVLVGASRLFLSRHWMTDLVGSTTFGISYLAFAAACGTTRRRLVFAGGMLLVVGGLCLAAACGGRIHLASPSSFAPVPDDGRLETMHAFSEAGVWWPPQRQEPGFRAIAAGGPGARLTGAGRVVKVVARPPRRLGARCHPWLDVVVSGRTLLSWRMRQQWRTYAFPLPPWPGRFADACLRMRLRGPGCRALPVLAVARIAVE
jgi:membrane-associated phospholipid phosphatase